MPLIKTRVRHSKQDKENLKYKVCPAGHPDSQIWPDGIFQWRASIPDIPVYGYQLFIASKADKTEMFLDYSEL